MTGTSLVEAARILNNNDLVAIPTETVYGLAGNAYSEAAVAKIFEVKNRPTFDPLIVHTHSMDAICNFARLDHPKIIKLLETFAPGPITALLPKKDNIPYLVTSGLPTVGVRIPAHPVTAELLKMLPFPLAAPSANPFGYISPTTAQHVEKQLGSKIPYILDGGASVVGVESTIVGIENKKVVVYRLGGLSLSDIEATVGRVEVRTGSSQPAAPGMLHSHYAPRKPFLVGDIDALVKKHKNENIGILSFSKSYKEIYNLVLSPKGDVKEAAQNLFGYMRQLDDAEVDVIISEYVPPQGLGLAINDRLKRASFSIA